MGEVIEENDLEKDIRYGHRITKCSWSSADALWTVEAIDKASGEARHFTANFLWMCQGYFDHEKPYWPDWPGTETFKGQLVHAQLWDLATDYAGKRIVVIGSGATAATIVPAVAEGAAHVTMLQRSPTYFYASPNQNELANALREGGIDEPTIHRVVRTKINHEQKTITQRCLDEPDVVKEELFAMARTYLGEDYDMAPHFTPSYRPWQQRLAFLPDGDLFKAIASGKASVVTDHIDRFTETGILLKSGQTIEADIIIAATGFNLSVMGEIPFTVDDKPVNWGDTVTYRGMLFTGVPNLAWVFGYLRYSWTLRVDIMGDFVCRMLNRMGDQGVTRVDVKLRAEDHNMPILPWIEEENFNAPYLVRGLHKMPKRGDKPEWRHNQDYWAEKDAFPLIDLEGVEFVYQ